MNQEAIVTLSIAGFSALLTWGAWVTVMVFELKNKISLIKQEISVLEETKEILKDLRERLSHGSKRHS
jgi:hypothetical protein